MAEKPVIILGAGATKACGGPLTDEILPAALNGEVAQDGRTILVKDREALLGLTGEFLRDCFNVPHRPVRKEDCPSLSMVLSMMHRSTTLGLNIGSWRGDDLIKAKGAVEYSMFAVIEAALRRIPPDGHYHRTLLEPSYRRGAEPSVVSLNYDVIVDNEMFMLSEYFQGLRPPDYCVDITTPRYKDFCQIGTFGRLLKIHGSLNWLYCEKCRRLDLFVSEGMRTAKALNELYDKVPFGDAYSCKGTRCRNGQCDGNVSPILITPTYVKAYENPHIERVWEEAERSMKASDRAVIIGYSLPTDDVEVAMLLKRGLDHLTRDRRITVVEFVKGDADKPPKERTPIEEHEVGRRFRSLFGKGLDWQTTGFEGWLAEQKKTGQFPFA